MSRGWIAVLNLRGACEFNMLKQIIKQLPGIRAIVRERDLLAAELEERGPKKVRRVIGKKSYVISEKMFTEDREAWLDPVYRAMLEDAPGLFVDVGVNAGQTLIKLLGMNFRGPYIGFEPQIGAAAQVEQFIHENGLTDFTILPVALSTEVSASELRSRGRGAAELTSEVSSLVRGFRPEEFYTGGRRVCAMPGDLVLSGMTIAILKVDVEGGELEVVKGLTGSLKEFAPLIVFEVLNSVVRVTGEVLPPEMAEFRQARASDLERVLRGLGYSVYQIAGARGLVKVDTIRLSSDPDRTITDYFAVTVTREKRFMETYERHAKQRNE